MRKRLRKKLHLGEFQELGFEVSFRVADDLSSDAFDRLVDIFIDQAIEGNGLVCGGGGRPPNWSVFVTIDGRGGVTEDHRRAVQQWLASQPEVREVQAGPLIDAWYSV
ncbi:MAG: DUF469 family protein [Candidatus Latescibacteria bacterium]|nr:DUF469 family protein [Candidatus Latescibacterota bacterium]